MGNCGSYKLGLRVHAQGSPSQGDTELPDRWGLAMEEEWAGHFVSKVSLLYFLPQPSIKCGNPAKPCWLQHPPLHLQKLTVSKPGDRTDAGPGWQGWISRLRLLWKG